MEPDAATRHCKKQKVRALHLHGPDLGFYKETSHGISFAFVYGSAGGHLPAAGPAAVPLRQTGTPAGRRSPQGVGASAAGRPVEALCPEAGRAGPAELRRHARHQRNAADRCAGYEQHPECRAGRAAADHGTAPAGAGSFQRSQAGRNAQNAGRKHGRPAGTECPEAGRDPLHGGRAAAGCPAEAGDRELQGGQCPAGTGVQGPG